MSMFFSNHWSPLLLQNNYIEQFHAFFHLNSVVLETRLQNEFYMPVFA